MLKISSSVLIKGRMFSFYSLFFFIFTSPLKSQIPLQLISGADGEFNTIILDGKTVYQSKGTSAAYASYIYAQCVPPVVNKTVYVELTFKDIGYGKITIDYNSATSDYQTVEGKNTFLLDHGGNIQISGSNISTPAIRKSNDQLITSATKSFFDLRVLGNPTENHFGLQPISSEKLGRMVIRISDINGRVIEHFDQLKDGQTLLIGEAYRQGIYFAELLQGNQRKVVRLMKLK